MDGKRLIASRQSVTSDFRMVLTPLAAGATAPTVAGTTAAFTVTGANGTDRWTTNVTNVQFNGK